MEKSVLPVNHGCGSTFFFSAGFACSRNREVRQISSLQQGGVPNLRGARVLVVEDNIINQQVTQELLERAGVKVTTAHNGVLAVQAVRENTFDLVLMDGCQATRLIRNNLHHKILIIIAMTAHAMSGDREKFLASSFPGSDHSTLVLRITLLA